MQKIKTKSSFASSSSLFINRDIRKCEQAASTSLTYLRMQAYAASFFSETHILHPKHVKFCKGNVDAVIF